MADNRVIISMRSTLVIRDSDSRTVLLIEARCGDDTVPILMQVVDPSDHEE